MAITKKTVVDKNSSKKPAKKSNPKGAKLASQKLATTFSWHQQ
jgi:hypothetical protein